MAETVTVDGDRYVRRNALGVAVLSVVTLGIYFFYWYFKVNDEARRYLRDDSIRPGVSLLAVLLGWILIVPPFVSAYHTAERIRRMQERAATVVTIGRLGRRTVRQTVESTPMMPHSRPARMHFRCSSSRRRWIHTFQKSACSV
jgi:hypothetical protein